jgi:hypothetical protein
LGAQKLFDQFSNLLTASNDGMLKEADYTILSSVFQAQLKYNANEIITWYSSCDEKTVKSVLIPLTPAQVQTLNSNRKRVEIDLWAFNLQHEDMRITNIEIDNDLVTLADPLPTSDVTLNLEYIHGGVSKVRRDGRLYLFRSGQYRVDGAFDRPARTDIRWGTTLEYKPRAKKLSVKPAERDADVKSLVNELISRPKQEDNPMTRFRPGGWMRLAVQRSGTARANLESLTLRVHYVSGSVNSDDATVAVKVADDAEPYIRCDTRDQNRRGDGTAASSAPSRRLRIK